MGVDDVDDQKWSHRMPLNGERWKKKDAATATMVEFFAMVFFIKMDVLAEASSCTYAISARALGCLRGARFASCRAQAF